MQQEPATAPPQPTTALAPPVTPPAQAPSATVLLPSGPIPLDQLPRTVAEVQGLRERREILRDQLSRASNRREEMARELNREVEPAARTGIEQRLNLLDERILQIEQDQAATERLLSGAPPEVLAQSAPPPHTGGMVEEEAAVAMLFTGFGLGILLAVFIGRLRRRRARRRGGRWELVEDPRLDQLTQAVDAIAEEVERIGEGQRFVTQLLAEGRQAPGLKGGGERAT